MDELRANLRMRAARDLIQAKQYDEARRILTTIDNPIARDWLAKLDNIAPITNTASFQIVPVAPIVTYVLITINVVVFLLGMGQNVYLAGATNQYLVFGLGEYYRLVSAMFLHAGIIHLVLNMFALFTIGRVLESYIGHARFLVIYFLGGLAGSLTSALLNSPEISSVGASGAVFALAGAELIFGARFGNLLPAEAEKRMSRAGQVIAANLVYGFLPDSNIDNWAHLGGAVGGVLVSLLIGALFTIKQYPSQPGLLLLVNKNRRTFYAIYAASGILAVLLCVTGLSALSPRTLTLDNITLPVPGGWHVMTSFEGEEFCQQAGVECVVILVSPSGAILEVDRFSGLAMLLLSLEQFDDSAASVIESEGAVLVSRDEIQVDGRAAIQRVYQVEDQNRMFIFLKDGVTFLRFFIQASQDTFNRSRDEIDGLIASVHFSSAPVTPVLTATSAGPSLLSNVVTAEGVDDSDCIENPTSTFSIGSGRIYVVALATGLQPGRTVVTARWRREGTEVATDHFNPDIREGCLWFFINETGVEFTPGNWSVELEINGEPVGAPVSFTIVSEPATP